MSYNTTAHYNELYHHGVKGQKWGVRRYQNEDGSLTAAGKKRYLSENGITLNDKASKFLIKNPEATRNYIRYSGRKVLSTMDDDELNTVKKIHDKRTRYNLKADKVYGKYYNRNLQKLMNGLWKSDEDIDLDATRKADKVLGSTFRKKQRQTNIEYYDEMKKLVESKIGADAYNTRLFSDYKSDGHSRRFKPAIAYTYEFRNKITLGQAVTAQLMSYLDYNYNNK